MPNHYLQQCYVMLRAAFRKGSKQKSGSSKTILKTKSTFLTGRGFSVDSVQRCIFFIIWIIGWLGKKYEVLFRKKRKNKRKEVEKRGKGEIFTKLGGKNIILEKNGWGKNVTILRKYTPLVQWGCSISSSRSSPSRPPLPPPFLTGIG